MTFDKIPRRLHQQRAERLEARFSPTWTGDSPGPTETVLPNGPASPAPAPAPPPSKPAGPVQPAPAPPTTPAAPVVPPPVRPTTSASAPVPPTTAAAPVTPVAPTTPSAVVPTTIPSSISVQTTPTLVATPTIKVPTVVSTPSAFRSLPLGSAITLSTTASASPTSTAAASSGMSTGSIVGIAAGGIAGVALVGALGIWVLKRYFNSRDHDEDTSGNGGGFNRHSWMRNSVALADDVPSPIVRGGMGGPSENPRPPTMIERKQTQNYSNVAASGGQYGQYGQYGQGQGQYGQYGQQGGYSEYQDSPYPTPPPMPSFIPGQHLNNGAPSPGSPQGFFSPISSAPPSPGMASIDETMPPMQHANPMPAYFSRHDSNLSAAQPESAALPDMPNPHGDGYATLDRTSVTPYQAQQYAEISRQLDEPLPPVSEAAPTQHAQLMEQAPRSIPMQQQPPATSPFEDPLVAPYQELPLPAPVHPRIDSTPPSLPPMRAMSPVSGGGANPSFSQLANAFPAAPTSPVHPAFPPAVAGSPRTAAFPSSPKSATSPPLSPGVGTQKGQVVTVPDVYAGRETPVQFGFTEPAHAPAPAAAAKAPSRPETMYDEEDAYGGI